MHQDNQNVDATTHGANEGNPLTSFGARSEAEAAARRRLYLEASRAELRRMVGIGRQIERWGERIQRVGGVKFTVEELERGAVTVFGFSVQTVRRALLLHGATRPVTQRGCCSRLLTPREVDGMQYVSGNGRDLVNDAGLDLFTAELIVGVRDDETGEYLSRYAEPGRGGEA